MRSGFDNEVASFTCTDCRHRSEVAVARRTASDINVEFESRSDIAASAIVAVDVCGRDVVEKTARFA